MTKILDCTLRDGGYYNDWNFPLDVAKRTVRSLSEAGVDIVEVGLKSATDASCSGLFKYCNEEYLGFLGDFSDLQFSFMLNVKEFIRDGKLDEAGLDRIIRPAEDSVFDLCRLAAHYSDIELVPEFHRYFKGEGYQVGINLMGISLLDDDQITHAIGIIEALRPDVFYVADSFGCMLPEDVSSLVATLRRQYDGPLGIHTHDNQGLAFANSLRAIEDGVEYIDATLTGMGRGAGNLFTEQILLWLQHRGEKPGHYHSSAVLDIIHDYYGPLKQQFKWGFNYVYMLSGLNNTHPVYCMDLCDGNKFSLSRISTILEKIPRNSRASFDRQILDSAINTAPAASLPDSDMLPLFNASDWHSSGEACLVVSTGPGIENYREAISNLVRRQGLALIECNDTGILDEFPARLGAVLNRMRLREIATRKSGLPEITVTGERQFDTEINTSLKYLPCQIGKLAIEDTLISIPDYEAGQYAIALAVASGYNTIYLAGFSGYTETERNGPMERFFGAIGTLSPAPRLTAVTPTRYDKLTCRSIYTL